MCSRGVAGRVARVRGRLNVRNKGREGHWTLVQVAYQMAHRLACGAKLASRSPISIRFRSLRRPCYGLLLTLSTDSPARCRAWFRGPRVVTFTAKRSEDLCLLDGRDIGPGNDFGG